MVSVVVSVDSVGSVDFVVVVGAVVGYVVGSDSDVVGSVVVGSGFGFTW